MTCLGRSQLSRKARKTEPLDGREWVDARTPSVLVLPNVPRISCGDMAACALSYAPLKLNRRRLHALVRQQPRSPACPTPVQCQQRRTDQRDEGN